VTGAPARPFGEGERVVLALRPHRQALVPPALVLLLVSPIATFTAAATPAGEAQQWVRGAVVVVAALVVLWWSVWPFLVWLRTSYVLTDRRLVTRRGVLRRIRGDLPLAQVTDVTVTRPSMRQRLLRCGTLVVTSADGGELVLRDVPRVKAVRREVDRLVGAERARRWSAR
jgi:uncharacterized membrane protein YdbT with pleckstrin-like domain